MPAVVDGYKAAEHAVQEGVRLLFPPISNPSGLEPPISAEFHRIDTSSERDAGSCCLRAFRSVSVGDALDVLVTPSRERVRGQIRVSLQQRVCPFISRRRPPRLHAWSRDWPS